MGDPEFKIRDLIRREKVRVFSSNYALDGDLSRRVGDSLHSMVPTVETYSIDESFLNLGEFNSREVEPLARALRERVHRWGGYSHVCWRRRHLLRWPTSSPRNDRSTWASAICVPVRCGRTCCPRCPSRKYGASAEPRPGNSRSLESGRPQTWLRWSRTMHAR